MLIGGRAIAAMAIAGVCSLWRPSPALACGGCFHEATPPPTPTYTPPPPSIVTDHRMVLSVSTRQTVLWDQIRYSGEPSDFAWVLPVRGGARLELARDEFIAALDASTTPVTQGPYDYESYAGCGLFGCSSDGTTTSSESPGPVDVLNQSVVGPYETVTLHAADKDSLTTWLDTHRYVIPAGAGPVVQAYIDEGFDFIALRLRPQCAERAMQPVRVISPGADPTLPLRMVTAGVGARVGLTLWILSEGRLEPENFPVATIDETALRWSYSTQTSNYAALSETLMSGADGRTWLIESSENAAFRDGTWSSASFRGYPTTGRRRRRRRGARGRRNRRRDEHQRRERDPRRCEPHPTGRLPGVRRSRRRARRASPQRRVGDESPSDTSARRPGGAGSPPACRPAGPAEPLSSGRHVRRGRRIAQRSSASAPKLSLR